jgi:type VI secretion system secreted protein VgrG
MDFDTDFEPVEHPINDFDLMWNSMLKGPRLLRVRFPSSYKLGVHHTMPLQIMGQEGLCEGFAYRVQVISCRGSVRPQDWIGKSIAISIAHDHQGERHISGFIRTATQLSPDAPSALYELEVVDALTMLQQRTTWRVFQNLNVIDITRHILEDHLYNNAVFRDAFIWNQKQLYNTYPVREFTLQAGESDHDFLTRLWRQEGICWHFTHEPKEHGLDTQPFHTLQLTDQPTHFPPNDVSELKYHNGVGLEYDTVTHWHSWRTQSLQTITHRQTNYKRPQTLGERQVKNPQTQGLESSMWSQNSLMHNRYTAPFLAANADHQYQHTLNHALHQQYRSKTFLGQGHVRAMCVGTTFSLSWQPSLTRRRPEDKTFLVTSLNLYARNNLNVKEHQLPPMYAEWQAMSNTLLPAPSDTPIYVNRFACVRKHIPVKPHFDPRDVPNIGPITATVICSNPEDEMDVDAQGRVLVQFPFTLPQEHQNRGFNPLVDTLDPQLAQYKSRTARIRVAQPWAHAGYGTAFWPRAGQEVIVQFLNNHPDKPIITGSVYNGQNNPAAFHHSGRVGRHTVLSGIRSKEQGAGRHNHVQLDDTPEQISAQLHSDHAHSQLTQGYLTAQRGQALSQARGEGFELCTDAAGAIRTAKGLLISAFEQIQAQGVQLSRGEALSMMQEALNALTQQGQMAQQHQGLPMDPSGHQDLQTKLHDWEHGSNTAPKATGGGAPIIAMTAPAGLIQNTPANIATQAGKNIDSVALQHHQFTSGKNTVINAGQGIGLYAHSQDLKTIAHRSQWIAQAQQHDAIVQAGKNIKLSAGEEILLVAGDGTFMKLGGGQLLWGTSGPAIGHAAGHKFLGPMSAEVVHQTVEDAMEGLLKFDEQFHLVYPSTDIPLRLQPYRIRTEDGQVFEGVTDEEGYTERIYLTSKQTLDLEILELDETKTGKE